MVYWIFIIANKAVKNPISFHQIKILQFVNVWVIELPVWG
jgi:hypothetical protein